MILRRRFSLLYAGYQIPPPPPQSYVRYCTQEPFLGQAMSVQAVARTVCLSPAFGMELAGAGNLCRHASGADMPSNDRVVMPGLHRGPSKSAQAVWLLPCIDARCSSPLLTGIRMVSSIRCIGALRIRAGQLCIRLASKLKWYATAPNHPCAHAVFNSARLDG